ncbi:hypothetical protein OG223_03000 [Streptomyces sp. NBC_01478]|uniref:hypothetical protein n=1 Tax=Streptomyces sp. NBC_01478 TaxID=2903882 RepID=UPI002E343852|nr:hypothetical protein [Streptomyces sp. NBC_01478]
MNSSADDDIRAVVGALKHRAAAREETAPALDSVLDLVANDEAEIAVDYLVNTANAFRLPVRQDEYDRLLSAATRLDYADGVTEIDPTLLLPDPDGT